ncbi:MAG TPA: sulfotransferase [Rhodanobacteraceae bacterium]|nr:sulfotransferase [Rhodanobacteraceae bacterium]
MADESVTGSIISALKAGDARGAEQLCRAALLREADDAEVLLLLGLSLQSQGRGPEALAPLARVTEIQPDESANWCNYATVLYEVGQADAARQAAERAAALAPDDSAQLEHLGQWCTQLGALHAAAIALRRAAELAPDSVKLKIEAARARIDSHDILAGEALLDWRKWPSPPDDLLLELANLLAEVSEPWDALEVLEKIVDRAPTDWSAQLLLAKIDERINRVEPAKARLDWIEAMQAQATDAEWILREIHVQRSQLAMREGDFATARRLLEQAGPLDAVDSGYYFALAKACDRVADSDAAVRALREAHRLQLDDLRASKPDLLAPDAALLPGVDDRVTAEAYATWPALRAPDTGQSPVFIVGFPRSGTTLLEQMLDAHPRLQSMDERPFLNLLAGQLHAIGIEVPEDLANLSQRDCDELRKGYVLMGCQKITRRWDARLVDKNPLNMLWLPMLHRLFPQAKIILAVRHPCDVIWSCYLQNFRAASLQAACASLEHLARAYVAAMKCWLEHVAVFHPDVLISRFEDLVADPRLHAERLARFLDVENAGSMLDYANRAREKEFIKTPSYTQVTEPINTRGVGHWSQYRPYFNEVLSIVQPMLEHWGYDERSAAPGSRA